MKMHEKIKGLYTQKGLRLGLYIIGGLFVFSVIFQLGVFVGYHKANYAHNFSDSYRKNFRGEKGGSFGSMMRGNNLPTAHGAFGTVLTTTLPTFIIEDKDGLEKSILILSSTIIKNISGNASSSSITPNNLIMVLGDPNASGQIEAKLIRIMPNDFTNGTNTRGMMGGNYKRGGMMFFR
jgi:hypothetical protein